MDHTVSDQAQGIDKTMNIDIKDVDLNNIIIDLDPNKIALLSNGNDSSHIAYKFPVKYDDDNNNNNKSRPLILNLVNIKSNRLYCVYYGCTCNEIKFRFNLWDPSLKELRNVLFHLQEKICNDVISTYDKEPIYPSVIKPINICNYQFEHYDLYGASYEFLYIYFPIESIYNIYGARIGDCMRMFTNSSSILDITLDLSNIQFYTPSNTYNLHIKGKKAIFYSKTTKRNNLLSEEYQARLLKLNII
jgi:hypothetical protein